MDGTLALIGFGEAAASFAPGLAARLRGYDRMTDDPATRDTKLADLACAGVELCLSSSAALQDAGAVLCLVTADQALAAAKAADALPRGAFWFDMNSVAPGTKCAAAEAIVRRGGRYVDVAVMAPVLPLRTAVPLLVSGPDAEDGSALLRAFGFGDVRVIGGDIGAASAVKMIRSVMIKGIEALSAECALAAEAAGVQLEVIRSLDASWPGADWGQRFDYNLDRMMRHGVRRAAEMEEVVVTLDALDTGSRMCRATADCQRTIGIRGIAPQAGLSAKLKALAL